MTAVNLRIMHEDGFHARPAALFVQVASRFSSDIWLEKGSKKADAKSIMGVMSLRISPGDEVSLVADGDDEKEAVEALKKLVSSNITDVHESKIKN